MSKRITFTQYRDGIWSMYISADHRAYITQYGFRDWKWTIYSGNVGLNATARGKDTSFARCKLAVEKELAK